MPKNRTDLVHRRQAGFTLIEVLVALVIAALGLGVLMAAASQGLSHVGAADRYIEATRRAQARLAMVGAVDAVVPGGSSGDDGGGFRWELVIAPLAVHSPAPAGQAAGGQQQQGAPAENQGQAKGPLALYSVGVTISWRSGAAIKTVSLRSQRVGYAGAVS